MSLPLHHHYCYSRCNGARYACVDPECEHRDEKDECCPRCYYGDDKLVAITVLVLKFKELHV